MVMVAHCKYSKYLSCILQRGDIQYLSTTVKKIGHGIKSDAREVMAYPTLLGPCKMTQHSQKAGWLQKTIKIFLDAYM